MTITILHFPKRRSPWAVRYYVKRARRLKFFATREQAESHASDIRLLRKRGTNLGSVKSAIQVAAGTGYDIAELVRAGLEAVRASGVKNESMHKTFREVALEYYSLLLRRARRRATLQSYRYNFNSLFKTFGGRLIASITDEEVSRYLESLRARHGEPGTASAATRVSVLRAIRTVMRFAGIKDPLPKVEVVQEPKEVRFFSVDDVRTLMTVAREDERGFLALALWAALRPCRLAEIPVSCIDVVNRTIRIPANVSKSRRVEFLQTVAHTGAQEVKPGPPEILWKWLERYPFWPVNWSCLRYRLWCALGKRWVHDGCRHTGATYYCAKYGVAATAELLTHGGIELVKKHYAGITTRQKADEFLALGPDQVPLPEKRWVLPRHAKIRVSKAEMERLLQTSTMTELARFFGCTNSAIHRFCLVRGIATPGRGNWVTRPGRKPGPFPAQASHYTGKVKISPTRMMELLLTNSTAQVAKILKVSDTSVRLFCLKYGIKKQGPAYGYGRKRSPIDELMPIPPPPALPSKVVTKSSLAPESHVSQSESNSSRTDRRSDTGGSSQ